MKEDKSNKVNTKPNAMKKAVAAENIMHETNSDNQLPIFAREAEIVKIRSFLEDEKKKVQLIIGQTGVGKTYIVQQILKSYNCRWIYLNAFKYTENDLAEVESLFEYAVKTNSGSLPRWCHFNKCIGSGRDGRLHN